MKTKFFGFFCAMIIGLMTVALFAHADPAFDMNMGPSDSERMGARLEKASKDLGLTADQQKKLQDVRRKNMETNITLRQNLQTKRKALGDELEKPDFNPDTLKNLNAAFKAAQSDMADQRINEIIELRQILTPDQFARLRKMMQDRRQERMKEFMEKKNKP